MLDQFKMDFTLEENRTSELSYRRRRYMNFFKWELPVLAHLKGHGVRISATAVRSDDSTLWVDLSDGRTLGVPLAWFPRLLRATPDQRADCTISRTGLHWDDLDEDISINGLIAGRGDQTRPGPIAV